MKEKKQQQRRPRANTFVDHFIQLTIQSNQQSDESIQLQPVNCDKLHKLHLFTFEQLKLKSF